MNTKVKINKWVKYLEENISWIPFKTPIVFAYRYPDLCYAELDLKKTLSDYSKALRVKIKEKDTLIKFLVDYINKHLAQPDWYLNCKEDKLIVKLLEKEIMKNGIPAKYESGHK